MPLFHYINDILKQPFTTNGGIIIGTSREGRSIKGFKFGKGKKQISLIAGNHADEPIGPLLLKKLVNFLSSLDSSHHLCKDYSWWIIPHTNPDGEAINLKWYSYSDKKTDLVKYLKYCVRELPGDDIEFGFPLEGTIPALRSENTAVYNFWKSAKTPFHLHVSLHGMSATYGPWFLIDETWIDRTKNLRKICIDKVQQMNYHLFDLNRFGEKGFKRIEEGFATRPDSSFMKAHFMDLKDYEMAQKFHASSMESIRSLSEDCLTLVTEMPLFIYPKEERELIWPDPYLQKWNAQFDLWKTQLLTKQITEAQCITQAQHKNIYAMPWDDQMKLQWQLICSGLEAI